MSTRKKLDMRSDDEDEDDDEDDEEEVEYSGMIQPPLIHQLRNILTEYPDGGQILKELIQNAEDAGANIMQIFYDQRAIIPSKEIIAEKKTPFRTYFKGPSLCFYNDALFTEKDWMGIKMMYNSIKVFDPLKVGKFGLGFKSVFHITEYPIIISGEYLLVIDPNKDSSKVCQTMKLRTIHRAKSRKMALVKKDCIRGLVGLFGFSERSLESGFFNGSILRLPLRQTPTELSDVVYDDIKARELLESFKEEASVCLLFLKSLSRIDIINEQSLNIAEPSSEPGCKDFEVFIGGDNTHEVVRCRQEFVQRIKDNEESTSNKTIRNSYKVTLVTDDRDEAPKHRSWSVVNMYMVEGMSEEMKRLGRDKDLSYSPYVGAAVPYTKEEDFIGHVFCFLPLPLQNKSLTGLPVHVNGFLALSQNRRHIKWPTVDQVRHSTHQDKPIRWNECLVKEALSEVYIQLVQALIDDSGGHSNPKHLVENVYQAIPDIEAVEDDWSIIIEPFLDALKKKKFLYTKSRGGEWIKIHNAVFVNSVQKEYQSCVKEILDEYEEKWVDIPEHVWYICQHLMDDVCIVTPGYLSSVLKTSTKYENCSREVKLDLLSFLLQEEDVTLLDGLDLLPVASGEFLQFDSFSRVTIYLCSETVKRLLPGLDEIIVSDLPKNVHSTFEEMAEEESWGQKEPLTRRLHNLLKEYKDGFAVPKEIVQNADDGGATKVCFLYDERENDEYRCRLIDENMAECHGPALWAYNNREFTTKDLENITKLSGATKEDDALTIGKFGLGFCSVYNLTDVPSFITGESIVIFDPHAKYLGKAVRKGNPGLKINLSKKRNKVMLRRMKNQFQPFEGVFGCEISETDGNYFRGTLFRLPLRNQRQADSSEISDKPYDRSEMKEFIEIFKKNAGNLLLFTQNIETIEFYHLHRKATTPKEKTLLYRIQRDLLKNPLNETPLSCMNNIMKSRFSFMKEGQDVKVTQLMRISITSNDENSQTSKRSSEAYWLVSWASGSKRSLVIADKTKVKGAIPLGAVGCLLSSPENDNFEFRSLASSPHGFYRESHIFCFLPLPVTTKLPVHVNGSFAITPDRRQLATKTKDDKSEFETTWNKVMFQDTLVKAYLLWLESLKEMNVHLDDSEYYNIWPKRNEEIDSLETCLCESFYKEIVSDMHHNVFRSKGLWFSFEKCVFLDPDLFESEIGANVSEATSFFGYNNQNVLSVPRSILNCIQDANSELDLKKKIFSAEQFYLDIFFPNVSHEFWDHNTRARLISYALDHHFEDVMNNVEDDVRFIPSLPDGKLKSPKELIHPSCDLKKIFSQDEGYFIHTEYGKPFMTDARLSRLVELGLLKDELPDNILIERAESIKVLFTQCKTCAIERSKHLLKFLNNKFQGKTMDVTEKEQLITLLKKTEFLPVLPKPKNWQIQWYADTLLHNDGNVKCSKHQSSHVAVIDDMRLCNPSKMFALECQHLVGTQAPILNERLLHYSNFTPLLKKLGVRYENSTIIENVLDHLRTLSENAATTNESAETVLLIEKECTEIYLFLQKQIKSEISHSQLIDKFSSLKNFRSIFVRGRFWFPHQVCKYLSYDCSPYLIGLDTSQLRHCYDFFQFLNIELSFSVQVITDVLLELKHTYDLKQPIQKGDSIRICNLLQLLAETMTEENVPSEYPSEMDIYVPDEHNVLKPIKDVCFDDVSGVKKTNTYIHDTISRSTAVTIGIKSKARGKLRQHSKTFRPFGQREELISRINRILSGYQCDVGILKELVQNADDAKATEIRIITDFQKHSDTRVFDDCWKPIQGPAILVYNNSTFSQDDLYGIQKIGIGSKADDPTKTGQFGVGFNAVYHLTDVPSFLTKGKEIEGGETLCIMDPHCKYVPEATHQYPGMQYVDLAELRESFPDVFSVFHESHFPKDKGTIFRFPLRTEKFAENSDFSNKIVTEAFIKQLMDTFQKDMPICLLFLNHVTSVSLHSVENSRMKELHRVQIKLTKEQAARKRKYVHEWKEAALKARDLEQPVDLPVIQSVFEATVSESGGSDHKWIISQRFGHRRDALPEKLSEAFRQKLIGLLPRGGVALCKDYLQGTSQKEDKDVVIEMKAFCTLPLPLNTGLPVHIDGHFALDHEARRNLWMDDKLEYRSEWNIHLMENVIAPAYIKCVTAWKRDLGLEEHCRIQANEVRAKLNPYCNSFPLFKNLVGDVWKYLVSAFYKELVKMAVPVFLSCRKVGKGTTLISCHPIQNGKSGFQIVFNTFSKELARTNDRMKIAFQLETIAKEMNMKLIDAPIDIYKCLEKLKINVDTSTPDFFMDFLRSFNSGMEGDCTVCDTSRNITHTKFKSIENLRTCLLYCMNSNSFKTKAVGVPLCLTEDLMWIDSIWKLLSRIKHSTEASFDACSKLQTISKWCLVPVVHASKKKLCRIQDSATVVDLATFDGELKIALQSLNIPFLDGDISAQPLLISSVISFREPKQLLDCLRTHLDSIASNDIRSEHCVEILAYFSERVDNIMKELNPSKCKEHIRSLPFFVAVQGEHIAVPNQRKVFVLPQGMPSAGIKEWAEKVDTTLLSANTRLRPLYELLEITNSTFTAVYLSHIFPTWHHLPKEDRICHLKFIKELVLYRGIGCGNADENVLQRALRKLPFVESPNNNPRVASSFFNKQHDIFKHLCHDSEFPPEPFCNVDWNRFMLFAGMKNEVDSDMLLQFAKRIQSECQGSTTKDLESKSRILVKHFLSTKSLQNESVLLGIKHISFVSPYSVSQTLKEMHDQYKANKLISFSGSSLKCHESILWSNTPLLPGWASPFGKDGEHLKKKLDIKEPSLEVVCGHVTKLCTQLCMKATKDGLKDSESVKKIMLENYEFLTENGLKKSSSKKTLMTLREIPLVFLPLKRAFVPCSRIVIGLKEENEIPGYLIKSPEAYGAFNELFVLLGTKRDGDCTVYTDVLAAIQSSTRSQRLHPNEMKAVAKAVEFFFSSFPRQCDKLKEKLKETKLFLPSTKHVLVDAAQLVIVHDDSMGRNLQDAQDISILIDFKELEIKYPISEDNFMHLPDHCRPKLLKEVLSEKINIQPLQNASQQDEQLLNEFVHSSEFLNGILRIVSRERKLSTTKHDLNDKEEEKIRTGLKRLHFKKVESIDTVFFYRKKEIGRKSMKSHYVGNVADERQIFEILFVRPETRDSKSLAWGIDGSLSKALSESTGESFEKSAKVLLQMYMEYQSPENIRQLLNENGFPEHSSSAGTQIRSVFPKLGSIVPDDFHHLLDDSICVFEEGDYVALNVHEQHQRETDDIPRTVYVFAKVLERLPFGDELPKQMQKYKVRVRTDREEIKYAYELYNFSRERIHQTSSTELVLYTREHDGDSGQSNHTQEQRSNERHSSDSPSEHQPRPTLDSRSLKDIFKEVREELKKIWEKVSSPEERTSIIRRLLRKWHPDKNYGNEKKAEEVFKYIKMVIEKLKRGQSVSGDDSDDDSNNTNHRRPPRPQPPSGFDDDFFDDDFFDNLFSGCRRDRERWNRSRRSRPQPGRDSSFYDFYEHHRRYEPNPQPYVARQWLRDAKKDLKMAQSSLSAATEEGTFNWTCLMCSQAVEKALKAAQYNIDAKKVFDGDNLIHNASSLNSEIKTLVRQFDAIVGSTRRMRYPDVVNISRLPSDLYTLSDANKALQHADQIISKISSIIV
ncbi:hypothetical protein FSP39_002093 [Pinctada imbricata]|uniref:HEPN domain-containing protein n=1 Tax=Pinctada imbricata TaxID=66713 RepID=A0AA88Y2L9_PINIB|nr:hypothetical protein FSP39_002093 [Pinctada imbricata]